MKNKKILILSLGVVLLAGCGFGSKNPQVPNPAIGQKNNAASETSKEEFQKDTVQDVVGKINTINNGVIEITTDEGESLTLKVPEKGASFMKQVVQADKKILLQEVGLFDLPKDKNLDIKYNGKNNEIMLIMIK